MRKKLVLTLAKYLGLFNLSRVITRRSVRILAYHGIWFLEDHFGNHLFMNPEKFESRMRWLSASPYSVISLDQAIENLSDRAIAPCSVVITIDDGWYGTYHHMLPSLEKYKLPASLYVYTGKVDSQEPLFNIMIPALLELTKENELEVSNPIDGSTVHRILGDSASRESVADELLGLIDSLPDRERNRFCSEVAARLGFDFNELAESRQFSFMDYREIADADRRGLDIQLHTHSHCLHLDEPGSVSEEIRVNREKLRPHVTSSLQHFCYPSGTYSAEIFDELIKDGIHSATLVDIGLAKGGDEPLALKRILDGEEVEMIEFEAELSGFMELMREATKIFARVRSVQQR